MQEIQSVAANPQSRSSIEERLIDQELFLLDPEDSGCPVYALNDGAAIVWYLCDDNRDVESIAGEIAAAFGLSQQDVLPKVKRTVTHLQTLGLLELNDMEKVN